MDIELIKEKELLKEEIKALYLQDERVFSLGYSGGKDSSCTLVITLEALLELPKESLTKTLYVLYSDTLMELLPVQAHTYKSLDAIRTFGEENNLPIVVMHAKPEVTETMWSMQIAKGVRPSSSDNRWCTTRLKTDVQERILYDTFGTNDIETISIVGSRKDESPDRKKRLEDNTIKGHLKGHNQYSKSLVFAPIEDYSTEDVWTTLRSSDIGRNILGSEELYVLYASTNGEGAECQTILGNANDSGKNPGCGSSQGRFGCWSCPLQHKKDKALQGMQIEYPYIKHLIEFRDWNVSIRDGNWHIYRDYYNHGNFNRLQYNLDNHRFGMTSPGGMNLSTRAEMLMRLLDTEFKIKDEVDMPLISDEELNFIQHRWIREGNFSLSAVSIAQKYGRIIEVTDDDLEIIRYAKAFFSTQRIWETHLNTWYNIYPDERFSAQFVIQVFEKYGRDRMKQYLERIVDERESTLVAEWIKPLQIRNQFYPSNELAKMIRREWETDEVSYVTKALVFDYEKSWTEEEQVIAIDPLEDPNISMEDKYAMLDNWETYVGHDSNDRFEHPEYMRFGGAYQYVKFRERQSEENRTKNKNKIAQKQYATVNIPKYQQQSFDFAA